MENAEIFVMALILGAIIGISLSSLIFIGDDIDVINTEGLGKLICEDKGYAYSGRDIIHKEGYGNVPVIYCRKLGERLVDGIAILQGGE